MRYWMLRFREWLGRKRVTLRRGEKFDFSRRRLAWGSWPADQYGEEQRFFVVKIPLVDRHVLWTSRMSNPAFGKTGLRWLTKEAAI